MENFGEKIKYISESENVLVKLYHKRSAIYFGIWLTSLRVDYKYVPILNEDDMIYNPEEIDEEFEYMFWINKDDWNDIKDDLSWEKIEI